MFSPFLAKINETEPSASTDTIYNKYTAKYNIFKDYFSNATYKFDVSSPDSGDVLTWNNTSNRME